MHIEYMGEFSAVVAINDIVIIRDRNSKEKFKLYSHTKTRFHYKHRVLKECMNMNTTLKETSSSPEIESQSLRHGQASTHGLVTKTFRVLYRIFGAK